QGWLDPVLSLEKTADPEILPVEGGTATFILEAKTSGLSPVNNVDMTDTLPISWTHVAGSTIVTYPDGSTDSPDPVQSGQNLFWNLSHEMDSNQTLRLEFDAQIQTGGSVGATRWDGFEDQVQPYSDGRGDWASDWVENGDGGGSSASGMIRIVVSEDGVNPYSGSRQLSLRNDDESVDVYIERSVNLSDFARPMLRFKRYAYSLDSSDENFYLDIHDGSSWYTGVITWTDGSQEGAWVQEEVDLSAYAATTTTIRFRSLPENKSDGDRLYIDDVEIYDGVVVNENEGQVVGEYRGHVFNATDKAVVYISALDIEKAVDRSTAGVGNTIEYTFTYQNNGPITTTGTYINDTIPWGTTFSAASSGGSYSSATNAVSWMLSDVLPLETGSVTFTVTVDDGTPHGTVVENSGWINSDQTGQVNSNLVETTVLAHDLTVVKSDNPDPVAAGMILTYTLVYTNNGPSDAQNVYITDTVPADVTFGRVVSEAPPLPSFNRDGQHLTWYTPTLAADASGTIVCTVTVNPDASGTITNNVVIASSTPETDPDNNEDNEPTAIGIPTLATIYGTVFDDTNGDGVQGAGEVGIANVRLTLDDTITTTTKSDGSYMFFTTVTGTHTVVETDPDGYFSTTSNEVHVEVSMGNSYRVDFGDALDDSGFAAIRGIVFEDSDGDGVWDAGEVGIEGVTITLDGSATATTNLYGSYTFSTTVIGTHTVVESDPVGYFSTTSNEVHVDVELGHGYQVDFGDAPDSSNFASIHGIVFEDSDGDGVWDAGEVGIEGVTITLDGVIMTTTDLYGGYTFSTTVEGVHTVVETDPD
ncbi:MAG: hypothetical protein OEW09_15080, partial [Anaerolineae bacterium]|nr:hypothetical protein [Anaerolineae bacterium]